MTKAKITHFKKDCIGCGACAAINPEFWEMDEEGLSHLKKSTTTPEGVEERIITTLEDKASNQEAADVCPVQIIHVKDIEE